jgi:hypothetical protein
LKWKKNIIHEGAFKGNDFANLEKAYNEEQEIIAKIKNLSDYRMLSYRARSLLVGTHPHKSIHEKRRELQKILNNPLLKSEQRALSYPAAVTYFHILANIYDNLRKDYEAFECRKKMISMMEDHPEELQESLTNYVVSVYNILGSSLALRLHAELEHYIGKLRTIEKTYSKKISDSDRLFTSLGSSIYELRMRIGMGEFGMGIENLIEIERELKEFGKNLIKEDKLYFFYLIAYGYFGAGKYDDALVWINRILNDRDVDRNSNLYTKSKILNLIIHYELGNLDLLDYLIRSAHRFFNKHNFSGQEEKIVVQFLRRLPDISPGAQLTSFFEEFLNHLRSGPHTKLTKRRETGTAGSFEIQNNFTSIAEFDFESWLEGKISGKTFADVIKEKHARRP